MIKLFCCCAVHVATHAYLAPTPHAYLTPTTPIRRSLAITRAAAGTDSEQWESFTTHHLGEWFGAKTMYDASGVIGDEDAVAITRLRRDGDAVEHVIKVPAAALAAAGCDRCADTIEWREIPAGSYREGALGRFTVAGRGACVGPTLLRSGGVSFEVALVDGMRRCTLTASYAPDESGDALALRRCVLSRERSDEFPDGDAEFHGAAAAYAWPDGGLAVDAPGGIAFCVAERIEAGTPAAVRLRWNALAADATLAAFPGPPVLASFDASS